MLVIPLPSAQSTPMEAPPGYRMPGGVWRALARRLPATPSSAPVDDGRSSIDGIGVPGGLWDAVRCPVDPAGLPGNRPSEPIWLTLTQRVDLTQYCPQRLPDITEETVTEDGEAFTVLRSPHGAYLRLTSAERELWHAMDGSRTVAQLATLGFMRFKQLLPVAGLVQGLKQQRFLTDTPVNVYRQLQAGLARHGAEGWGRRLLSAFKSYTLPITNIDSVVTTLYRSIGWVCFTRPFQGLHILLSVVGLLVFISLLRQSEGVYQVIGGGGATGITFDLLLVWVALLVSFVLHEMAHALAVKHHGRTVWKGGIMLYYGMPAAFVDTSDIWLAGRRARIFVSAAGPLSDVLVGGIAALSAFLVPDTLLTGPAYTLAFACYAATLFNLNPLLELDGYYMLVDALRMPDLRRRALAFVRGPLWSKIRSGASFSAEEKIFTLYGLLTAIYTLCAIVLALLFWQRQLVDALGRLWSSGWGGRLLAVLITGGIVVPIVLGLLLGAWALLRSSAAWVERWGYGRRPRVVAAALLVLVTLLAGTPLRFGAPAGGVRPVLPGIIEALLWGMALIALLAVRPDYRGAAVRYVLNALLVANVLTLLTTVFALLIAPARPPLALRLLEVGAFLAIMLAGFAALLDVDLHQASRRELALTAFLLVVAFGLGGVAIRLAELALPDQSFGIALVIAAPVYFGALALALLLPHVLGLRDSLLLWCWLPLWLGIGAQTTVYGLALAATPRDHPALPALGILAAGLWASAWCVHYVTLRTFVPNDLRWPGVPARSEAERLQRGFQLSYAGCYRLLRAVYGARRAQALDDRVDVLAATANWEVTLDRDQARISPTLLAQSLDAQGIRYAEVLRYTVSMIEEIAGARFARRVIQAAYDALPWPEREATDRRCFPHTPWAQDLSRAFGSAQQARLRLLRQVDLFMACNDDELIALASTLQTRRVSAGYELLAAGEMPAGIWIIEAGEVAVWHAHAVVEELHRGDSFGVGEHAEMLTRDSANSQLSPRPARASYRTTIASTLLFLPTPDFQQLLRERTPHAAEGLETITLVQLLERVPLFAEVPRHTLRRLARIGQRLEIPPRTIMVRQGQPSGTFYIIKRGYAAVVLRTPVEAAHALGRATRVVAQLGPEEFFGEIELLRGTAPVASVVSITPMVMLALPHAALAALLMGSDGAVQKIERVGTGRLLHLRAQTEAV